MSIVVFCGPTLGAADRRRFPNVDFLPPVQQGDLYGVARDGPRAIGIVDGYFDGVPAVWHKEILWALGEGIAVFGASSMGALRAAELHPFGMVGVGRIFEDFRDGRLTDDDEVAIVHGPAELGYPVLSEPMVNIRATVELARSVGILDVETAALLITAAKGLFYQHRTWASAVEAAAKASDASFEKFIGWLDENKVDQKRHDSLTMLAAMEDFVASDRRAQAPNFVFECTEAWAGAPWLDRSSEAAPAPSREGDAILDELRLNGADYARVRGEALLRMLAATHGSRAELRVSGQEIRRATGDFRRKHGMLRQADLVRWSEANDIGEAGLRRLMAGEATIDALARSLDRRLRGEMLDRLRLENSYGELRDRALQKSAGGLGRHHPRDEGLSARMLGEWYFRERLGTEMPDDLDTYVKGLGIESLDDFYLLLASEYMFLRQQAKQAGKL